jgi:hypothetical protein
MTPQDRIDRYMRAQLEHDAWRQYRPEPAPEPRYLQAALNALAVLSLAGWCAYLLADSWSWTDLRDGMAAVWGAL